jgi:D-aminoacyl-tRNA deacylase
MRALVQRVKCARVFVRRSEVARIGPGMLVLLGITHSDTAATADRLAEKTLALRIFEDEQGRMNRVLQGGEILCVSQFTLYADTSAGNRPSFTEAAPADHALALYERFCERTRAKRGVFGAHMEVELLGDGPVTVMLEL